MSSLSSLHIPAELWASGRQRLSLTIILINPQCKGGESRRITYLISTMFQMLLELLLNKRKTYHSSSSADLKKKWHIERLICPQSQN